MTEPPFRRADRLAALPSGSFLPDLCRPTAVLGLVLGAALVAFILALAGGSGLGDVAFWVQLAGSAWLLLWIVLGSAALLCLLRRSRVPTRGVRLETLAALAVMMGVTALASLAAGALGWRGLAGSLALNERSGGWAAPEGDLAMFVLRNVLLALLLGGLGLRYAYVTHQWRLQVEAESEARLAALQARIRPHFLFNSLNTVAALAPTDGERAAAMVEDLADLFRASLAARPAGTTLEQELETARAYLRLEQARLGARLNVEWQLADLAPSTPMPALMLQPLLENAVYHGIERLPTGGTITVRGGHRQDHAWLAVENPLPLATASMPRLAPGHQEALANIRERLALLFGAAGQLEIAADAARFTARLSWPASETRP